MDEVAIVTANPVKTVVTPQPQLSKPKPAGTFLNFFYMMPLAVIILIQANYFGRAIGEYTALPFFTFQSYMVIGALLMLMLVVQLMMRSIIYSTIFGFALLAGILQAWFGDFWTPLMGNFKEVIGILKAAWTKKDIPFPILMSTILTVLIGLSVAFNFFLSLFVKYFFEAVFGNEWSDGRKGGFVSTILLMAMVHLAFSAYYLRAGGSERIEWVQKNTYKPLEEYCSAIPSAAQYSNNYVWNYDPYEMKAFDAQKGTEIRTRYDNPITTSPLWTKVDSPFIVTKKGVIGYDKDLLTETWKLSFPEKLPGLELPKDEESNDIGVPLVLRTDISPDCVYTLFNYGYWGAFSPKTGKLLWLKAIDAQERTNRLMLDEFIHAPYIIQIKNTIVFSCNNGRIAAIKAETGDLIWEDNYKEAKFAGRGQRAFLSTNGEKVLAAFPSGSLVVYDLAKGTKLQETKSVEWHPTSAAVWEDEEVGFISSNGNYIRLQIDGGKVIMNQSLIDNRLPLMPVAMNLQKGFVGFKETLYLISSATRKIESILTFPKHIFAAGPVFDGSLLFIGTQDGWVICLHKDSHHEKWRTHVGGELAEDSLAVAPFGLLVRTRSGSIYCLKKEAEQ